MRQLDSCDFCGDAPEGVFEVVPASVAGQARRLALCADCRATLQSVTDPLLDAASTSPDRSDPEQAATSSARAETPAADRAADETDDADDDSDAESGAGDGVTIDAGGEDAEREGSSGSKPDGYAKVLRLLQNRDGAMPRDDLRALATNAYDLSANTFRDAVDAAIENGDLTETNAGLQTT